MTWEVFYTPHTDDESIGMAGAIVRAVTIGHSVLVCLVTDNLPSPRGRSYFPIDGLEEVRLSEWRKALMTLGVTEYEQWNLPEAEMPQRFSESRTAIRDHMLAIHRSRLVVHHHTTWGMWDQNGGARCLAHDLCASAAFELSHMAPNTRVSLYGIYEYSKIRRARWAPRVQQLTRHEHMQKRQALLAYMPGPTSLGYGYRSVPELIDGARSDPREFIVEVTNGPHRTDA